ncbi:hypothetical protein KKI24_08225 [bacterium]|nr:hypothetical protein [bacterium]
MKIITTLAGLSAPVSAIAGTGLIENHSGIIACGCLSLLVGVQLLPIVFILIAMVQVVVSVVSKSSAVQHN